VKQPEKTVEIIRKLAETRLPSKDKAEIIKKVAREPDKAVEEIISEVTNAPYEMQFTAIDKEHLLNGTKTQTSKTSIPDPKIRPGAVVHAAIFEPHVAELRITSVERKRLKYFDEEDAKREGGYNLIQFKKMWKETHGEWDEDQLVYIIRFDIVS
jgi:hypothetical protein